MANKFVWSGATGLNDGSSWEDAYVTLMRDWGAEGAFTPATDHVYVRSVHAESTVAIIILKGSTAEGSVARVSVRSVVGATTGTTPGNLAAGASVKATAGFNIRIVKNIYIYGVDFDAGNDLAIGTTDNDLDAFLEKCTLSLVVGAGAGDAYIFGQTATVGNKLRFLDCTFTPGNAGNVIQCTHMDLIFDGCDWTANTTTLLNGYGNERSTIIFRNCDLSNISGNLCNVAANHSTRVSFIRCLLHASTTLTTGVLDVPGFRVEFLHCQVSTDADPAFQMEVHTKEGTVLADTARYRTGGARDGERTNPISWDMDTTVGSVRSYPGHALESPPISGWTDGDASTAHTYRIYFASGGTQQDDDIWFDLVGPNDAATNSLGVRNTTRVAPEGTPANYTTDGSSTWTGADVGTKQYMEFTYTPDKPGPISVIVYMATDAGATGHIFIDPKIYIDP